VGIGAVVFEEPVTGTWISIASRRTGEEGSSGLMPSPGSFRDRSLGKVPEQYSTCSGTFDGAGEYWKSLDVMNSSMMRFAHGATPEVFTKRLECQPPGRGLRLPTPPRPRERCCRTLPVPRTEQG